MQDKILLGFLLDGDRTGYQIKKLMELTTGYFFNTSLGSIYPAFKKLEREGMVRMKQKVADGRVKNIYSITPEGKRHFQDWLKQDLVISKIRDEPILKIFFFSHIDKDMRKVRIESYLSQLKERIKEFENLLESVDKADSKAGKNQESGFHKKYTVDPFRLEMLEYGIKHYSFLYRWHKDFLKRLNDIEGIA